MSTRISREKRSNKRPADEADRRFALVGALTTPEGRRDHSRRDGSDRQERSMAFDPPVADEGEGKRRRLQWQRLTLLLFVGCLIAAIVFIVAALFIKL
jgi:hypothetical protein